MFIVVVFKNEKISENLNFYILSSKVRLYQGEFVFDKIDKVSIFYFFNKSDKYSYIEYLTSYTKYTVNINFGQTLPVVIKNINEKYGYNLYLWYKHVFKKIEKQQLEILKYV